MAPPKPDVALKNHCSVVHENTLYVYSPDAFQSISLTEDAEWKTLKFSVAATGAQCVYGGGALYVVGGTVDASLNYPGLMKYDFAAEDWEWITPADTITAQRVNHGAAYLESSSQILIYAGSQVTGDQGSSSGTYTINTAAPYSVSSYPSGGAPNVVSPILLTWDDSTALMVGGGASQAQIFKFSVANGWENLGIQLPAAIADQTTTKCTLVDGDDGSKVLEQYNLGASPNEVTRLALLGAGGAQATTGQAVGAKRKRDLTLSDWPSYNSSLAPDTTRSGASIAQDSKGRAIISGGDDSDPIAIFDERENTWMNATELFYGSQQPTKISSSSSSKIASATSSSLAAASSTVASAIASATASATGIGASSTSSPSSSTGDDEHKNRMLTVLGATLGTIFGLAAVLIIILLLLRCKRQQNKGAGGEKGGEKDRLSFADRGVSQFGGYPGTPSAPPYMQDNNASQTSLAIISGKIGNGTKAPKTHTRGLPSDASTAGLVKKQSPLAYQESHEMSPIGAAPPYSVQNPMAQPPPAAVGDEKPSRSRSSGWSRYFANNEATNLASEPYDRSTYASNHSRFSGVSQSEYDTNSRYLSEPQTGKFSHPSQVLPPLDVSFANNAFDGNRISRVVTASPTIGNSREDLSSHGMGLGTPMRAELARANSVSTISSFESKRMSHAEGQQTWTPIEGSQWNNRAASSLYPDSRPQSEVAFQDGTSSYYPNDGTSSYYPKSSTPSLYPPSLHPDTAKMPAPGRESTMTVFPRGVPSTVPTDDERQKALGNQDMSWLKF
ncbi:Galactose oxidase/kelch beta-propeller [Neofusicoccum parvum]|uniref:Galactose oxidase/kelch beta-propeller n=2 Tax=Neofusicoccum parvum TaxID=310453 RepID=A0ACB5RRM8_9PEZI|nr:putative pre-mrna splicing factor clf1 protein [Neofusicoccum parvum UCRNP2]GME23155.1 Galactose oxidase/kelch beta-propeller [Neofusicoccum parvum]GME51281.1 Galactose oxidase/kelch beta-propeller [Neofusicoccum parvum]